MCQAELLRRTEFLGGSQLQLQNTADEEVQSGMLTGTRSSQARQLLLAQKFWLAIAINEHILRFIGGLFQGFCQGKSLDMHIRNHIVLEP